MPPTLLWENIEKEGERVGREGWDEMLIADTAAEIASLLLVRDIKKWNERRGRWKGMLRWG